MINILETVEQEQKVGFQPTTPDEFFALRLAERLGDAATAKHYAELAGEHSPERLLSLYHRIVSEETAQTQAGKRLHVLLTGHAHGSVHCARPRLLAVAVMRRAIATALFVGTHLEGVRLRHLPSVPSKAEFSAAGFLGTALLEFRCDSVAIERMDAPEGAIRGLLHRSIVAQWRNAGVPIYETGITAITQAYAYPTPRTRKQTRAIVAGIWPLPGGGNPESVMLDALALGLYVQTERLFASQA